jgi:hypothetical protein
MRLKKQRSLKMKNSTGGAYISAERLVIFTKIVMHYDWLVRKSQRLCEIFT